MEVNVWPFFSSATTSMQLLAEGKSTKEVAVTLGITVKTSETHRSNLMRKQGFALFERTGAVRGWQ
jgi:DNA-binding NarL/FixJ family response regulator